MLVFDRTRVLAYRYAVQGLGRSTSDPVGLGVFDLGVPDSPAGGADQSLHARRTRIDPADERFTLAWSLRGAPHLHRLSDLGHLAAELRPVSDADVLARMPGMSSRTTEEDPLRVFNRTVRSMRAHSREPTDKATLSAAVSGDLPEVSAWCRGCAATHISYSVFLHAALPAGIRLEREGTGLRLLPLPSWRPPDRGDIRSLIHRTLKLLGPATIADTAAFLGTRATAIRQAWPDDLVEVVVEGKRAWMTEEDLPLLESPPPPEGVRLLPPGDSYLQHRDRTLTVPIPAQRKALWRPLGSPGALLADGEVAGFWRAKKSGTTLRVTVTAFGVLPATVRESVAAEADGIAALRGARSATVQYESP